MSGLYSLSQYQTTSMRREDKMPTGNDTNNCNIARANCSYCAVGGLVGKTSGEIMRMVYTEMGETLPTGDGFGFDIDDGSMGFAIYFHKFVNKQEGSPPGNQTIVYQVKGIEAFLKKRGCTVVIAASKTLAKAEEFVSGHPDGTLFLILGGEELQSGRGPQDGAHWLTAQVQGGSGMYYDYQTKISNGDVRSVLATRTRMNRDPIGYPLTGTRDSRNIIAAFGNTYSSDSGRAIVLTVAKPG